MQKGDILVGEYRILDIFGGAMGFVYLVEDRDHESPIVIKTFQRDELPSIDRLKAEAEIWIGLGIHPNIVQAHFVRNINDQLFIGAEYIAPDEYGRNTLTHYLDKFAISDQYAIRWTAQFCYGMRHSIARGLRAHRDIKPDNLMVDSMGNLRITDFGIAKSEKSPHTSEVHSAEGRFALNLTNPGSFVGTGLYASPEQFENASAIDFRSDIYSFGIVLYEIIGRGRYPYDLQGRTTLEHVALMHWVEPVLELEHPLFPVIKKCLEKDADQRYRSYDVLLSDIENVARSIGVPVPHEQSDLSSETVELYRKALSLTELGKTDEALNAINEILSLDPSDPSAWQLKGRIDDILGDTDEAIRSTGKALELDPSNSRTLNNLGNFLGKVGRLDEGIAYLTEAIKADGYNAGAVINLANALDQRGAYVGAADMAIKALELTPDKTILHFNAGNIAASALKHGHTGKAKQILSTLAELGTNNPVHLFNLGVCCKSAGDSSGAATAFEKVLELEPLDEKARLFLIQVQAESERFHEAIKNCEFLIENELSLLSATSYKAQCLQAIGEGAEAILFIKSILNDGNSSSDALWMLLATLYENERKFAVARKCYAQARDLLVNQENPEIENVAFLERKIREMQGLASAQTEPNNRNTTS